MHGTCSDLDLRNQRKPRPARLAACLVTALGLAGVDTPALANTVYPLACGDPAAPIFPTLRSTIASALNGDTVDLSKLNCATPSLITLAQGEINILQSNLTIYSPPGSPFTIDAAGQSRIFEHKGAGVLALQHLRLTNGIAQPTSYSGLGGCVGSSGSLELTYTNITGCTAKEGGGLYSAGHTKLIHSIVSGNTAKADNGAALGGGIFAGGYLTVKYSSIINNHSEVSVGGAYALGNITTKLAVISGNTDNLYAVNLLACTALTTTGSLNMTSTSVEGNYGQQPSSTICAGTTIDLNATTVSGNLCNPFGSYAVNAPSSNSTVTLTNSTISGNLCNGVGVDRSVVKIFNSTIAFNGGKGVVGAFCYFEANSSIISNNNTYFPPSNLTGADVYLNFCTTQDPNSNSTFVDNDVIVHSNVVFPGATTIISSDPRLAPLASHGGPVKTHALSPNSPAVDAGNNLTGQANDARGAGFVREVGAAADIGAYERQANDDEIFYGGFN